MGMKKKLVQFLPMVLAALVFLLSITLIAHHQPLHLMNSTKILNPKEKEEKIKFYRSLCHQDRKRLKNLLTSDPRAMSKDEIYSILAQRMLTPCGRLVPIGGNYRRDCHAVDGHKYICLDDIVDDIKKNECLIYTFGIDGDWTFEDLMINMGCKVFGFDPSVDRNPSMKFEFSKVGLADATKPDGSYMTFHDILKMNNHTDRKISLLKIDIEGAELTALPQALESKTLDNVDQLALEFHLNHDSTRTFMKLVQNMTRKLGFRQISFEVNSCWRNALRKSNVYPTVSEVVWKKVQSTGAEKTLISNKCGYL